ncbi:hypothetical protein GUJ93_ZPchr0013g34345 [Zizania palustris]|uniref:Uncharacterized protein n=1 Tax=Zizania palustris TaxID=103762 RepID=A0A8J6BYH7_ZIZPA|nr:hypothetical protein GUJ93_ZPchr0013g34345 [Zizania palustris]
MENELARVGKADFGQHNDAAAFGFLCQSLLGQDPVKSVLGQEGPKLITKWVLFQLSPLFNLGLPTLVEDALLHSFRLPPALVKKDYDRLADFFRDAAKTIVDEGERLGIPREEAVHNILFALCFNSFALWSLRRARRSVEQTEPLEVTDSHSHARLTDVSAQ